MENRVYLDNAASTPLFPAAVEAMRPYLESSDHSAHYANPNSLHSGGRDAFNQLEEARSSVSRHFGVRPFEIVFTGSATEADNAALWGSVLSALANSREKPHIVTTSVEHDAVFSTAKAIEALQLAEVSIVNPERNGIVHPEAIKEALRPTTVLVSVIAASNETGALNNIVQIGELAQSNNCLFHTDAVQALGKLSLSLASLPVDIASFSAHKIGGPKGVGCLYLSQSCRIKPFITGGGQERGLRSGTQNLAGIAGFAAALDAVEEAADTTRERWYAFRDLCYAQLCEYPNVVASVPCTSGSEDYLPNIVNVCVRGVESETLLLKLDQLGFAVSGGSACSSHSLAPSRVLLACGIDHDTALGSLRLSFGHQTTLEDIEGFLSAFNSVYTSIFGERR